MTAPRTADVTPCQAGGYALTGSFGRMPVWFYSEAVAEATRELWVRDGVDPSRAPTVDGLQPIQI